MNLRSTTYKLRSLLTRSRRSPIHNLRSKLIPRHILIAALCLLAIIGPSLYILTLFPKKTKAAWYNTSWLYRTKITISSAYVDADLTDYPIYIDLSDLPAGFHTNVNQTDARDIRVTKADGTTELPREVVSYDSTTDTGELHLQYTGTLSSTIDTDIYIYYGNSGASDYAVTDTYGAENVWDSNYVGVWHLNESSSTRYDSTSNNNDLTSNGTGGVAQGTGALGYAADFERSDSDFLSITDGAQSGLDLANSDYTMEFWVNFEQNPYVNHAFIDKYDSVNDDGDFYSIRSDWNGSDDCLLTLHVDNWSYETEFSSFCATGTSISTWYYHSITFDDSADEIVMCRDGSCDSAATNTTATDGSTNDFHLGYDGDNGIYLDGMMDEVRISNSERTSTWDSTSYNNQSSPGTFYTAGSEEAASLVTLSTPFDNEKTGDSTPDFEFETSDPDGTAGLTYHIEVDDDYAFGSPLIDCESDTTCTTGAGTFTNTEDAGDSDPFTEEQLIRFTPTTAMSSGTTYYWRIRAKDSASEGGSGTYADWSSIQSVTYVSGTSPNSWYQTTDEQFDTDTLSSTETTGSDTVELSASGSPTPYVKTQHGTLDFASGDSSLTQSITAVADQSKAFILVWGTGGDQDIERVKFTAQFNSNSQIQIDRGESGSTAKAAWQVIEADDSAPTPAFTTQTGTIALASGDTTGNDTITNVSDTSQTTTIVQANCGSSDDTRQVQVRGYLSSTTQVDVARTTSGSACTVRYWVVKWHADVNVYNGSTANSTGSDSASIGGTVNLSRTVLFMNWDNDTNGLSQHATRGYLDTTTVYFSRDTSTGTNNVEWSVVEFPSGAAVQADNGTSSPTLGTSGTTTDETITTVTDGNTFVVQSQQVTGTGSAIVRGETISYLTSTTNLRFEKLYTGQSSTWSYYVADLSSWTFTAAATSGTITSSAIEFNSVAGGTDWDQLIFTDTETSSDIKYDIEYFNGSIWQDTAIVNQDTSPVDISSLSPITHATIRIVANLTDSGASPILTSWEVTWDTTAHSSFQRKTWYDGTRYWRSSYDLANSRIEFEYSTNGSSWTENTSARITTTIDDFSIEADTSNLFVVYTNSHDIRGRVATSYPGTGFSWGSENTTLDGSSSSDDYSLPVITRDSSSYVWVGARYTGSGVYYFTTIKEAGATNDLPEDSGDTVYPLANLGNTDNNVYGNLAPLGSQNIYATFAEGSSLEGCKWVNTSTEWQDSTGNSCAGGVNTDPTQVTSLSDTTTTSSTYELLTGMTSTPGAGDYMVHFSTSIAKSTGSSIQYVSLYLNGSPITHTERVIGADSSYDSTPPSGHELSIQAYVPNVGAGEAITVQWKTTAGTATAHERTLIIQPVSSADISQATADTNTTTSSSTDTQLTGMTVTPGAGDYLIFFSGSIENDTVSDNYISIYVNGSQIASSERYYYTEDSFVPSATFPIFSQVYVPSVGAGQAIEIKWRASAGTATSYARTLTVQKVSASNVTQATATSDPASSTSTNYVQIDSMTVTPGAGDYLAFFSSSMLASNVGGSYDAFTTLYSGGSQITHTERQIRAESSFDTGNIVSYPIIGQAYISSLGASDAIQAEFKSDSGALTPHQRVLTALKISGVGAGSTDSIATGLSTPTTRLSALSDSSNNIHLVYIDSSGHTVYQEYTTSWQSAVTLDSNADNSHPTIAYHSSNNNLYAFWIRGDDIYYKLGGSPYTSGYWDVSATSWQTTGTNINLISGINAGGNYVFAQWYDGSTLDWDWILDNTAPATPSLDSPTDTATGQSLTPTLKTTTTDADSDYLRYKIELCENVGMTTNCQTFDQTSIQTGWSGQDAQTSTAYASGTQASYTLQSDLSGLTTYYWRSYAIDPAGTNTWSSTQGTPYSFTTVEVNVAPNTPSLDSPTDTATDEGIYPTLLTTTTDANSDYIRYKIELCENVGMTTNCQTFDQTSIQTGWSGQDAETSTAYASGTQASYTLQSALSLGTTYYWRSYAIDPGGTNTWSSTQGTPYSFTTIATLNFNFQGVNLEGLNLN